MKKLVLVAFWFWLNSRLTNQKPTKKPRKKVDFGCKVY